MGVITATAVAPLDSPWFCGHFPDNPVLPAIAQLAIVLEIANKAYDQNMIAQAVNRTKFRRIIRPCEMIDILMYPVEGKTMTYSFQLTVNGEIASKGSMKTALAKSLSIQGENKTMQGWTIQETIEGVAQIVIDELKLEDVTPQTFDPDLDLVDEVGVDSMDLATVALVLQDEFGITIDEDDYPKLKTIRLIAEYVLQHAAVKNQAI